MKLFLFRCIVLLQVFFFLLIAVSCNTVSAVEPTPYEVYTMTISPLLAIPSVSIPLNGEWCFSIDMDRTGEKLGWADPAFGDSAWMSVNVPHTWNVMPEYLKYEGIAWYRRTFTVPSEAKDAHLRLHFEAVFYLARVWLNGQYLGEHEGGYTPFEFDVSAIARPGEENLLAVQVDNVRATNRIPANLYGPWSFDWWNYGGITRDVSLEVTSRAYIARQQIVSVPHLTSPDEADSAKVTATITINNTADHTLNGTIRAELLDDATGQSVLPSSLSYPANVSLNSTVDVQLEAMISSPKLWHFDHPNLYRWSASLLDADGQVLHTNEVTIGIRSVELKDGYFYLNGEPVRLVGVTRHADYPGQGSAETVTAMAADYDDLKTLNEVLSRPVHYPQHDFVLDYADRHGILLIPEVPAWQLTHQQMDREHMRGLEKQQLSEMIVEDFNHPSVWAWSIANEIESNTPAGHDFVSEMIAYVKSLDSTRPVGFASNRLGSQPQFDATASSDFVLMNQYFGTWAGSKSGLSPALDLIHETWPQKTVIISEYGFEPHWDVLMSPSFDLKPDQYYSIPKDTLADSEEADIVRQQVITEQMDIFRSKPFVSGAVFWTYQDYRTPTNFIMGLVDFDRNRRGSWDVLREEYAPALIDSLALSAAADGNRTATITLHTRGPVDMDMPAYTLRGYSLHWAVTSSDRNTKFSAGDISLPTFAPGSRWSGDIEFAIPKEEYIITVTIIRSTGYDVFKRSYNEMGELIP